MLKAKTKRNAHKSRTLDSAIKDVQKVDEVMLVNKISKELHTKFKIKVTQQDTNMKEVLVDLITRYIDK